MSDTMYIPAKGFTLFYRSTGGDNVQQRASKDSEEEED